ncbi:hypothetical protein Tsubulata_048277 [Turnera subulata]|uniref:Uncharacterized protein n=1 Tax=Turnera subulata TaxID=218843 RepID=A0A9Q0FH28_9ROSI|nr:hypothetical protein Tsubulata_048277 [Turnera subulata]
MADEMAYGSIDHQGRNQLGKEGFGFDNCNPERKDGAAAASDDIRFVTLSHLSNGVARDYTTLKRTVGNQVYGNDDDEWCCMRVLMLDEVNGEWVDPPRDDDGMRERLLVVTEKSSFSIVAKDFREYMGAWVVYSLCSETPNWVRKSLGQKGGGRSRGRRNPAH